MFADSTKDNNYYLFGKRKYDILLFAFILVILAIIAIYNFGVYYRVFVAEAEFHRIDPSGDKTVLPTSKAIEFLKSYPLKEHIFWKLTTLYIKKEMEKKYQINKYDPNTEFIWTVKYSYNSFDLDQNKKFVFKADNNGKLIYQPQ